MDTPVGQTVDGVVLKPIGGPRRDNKDSSKLRHGRLPNVGFRIGQQYQTPPMFFTREAHTAHLIDKYKGYPAFLIAGGPSFAKIDKSKLAQPGVLTMGYNNVVKVFRPKMWSSVDHPQHFLTSIWKDPTIEKYVPFDHCEKQILDVETLQELPIKVGDCPNVWFFRRNEYFNADRYLWEDTINWGNHGKLGGARTGILASIRILWLLGIRTIFLLGVDYKMDDTNKYCFAQNRTPESIKGNEATYQEMQKRFAQLRPVFERYGLNVYNCNPDSRLRVFDFVNFDDAVKACRGMLPTNLDDERTEGLYERNADEAKVQEDARKDIKEQKAVADAVQAEIVIGPGVTLEVADKNKKEATKVLNAAKAELQTFKGQHAAAPTSELADKIAAKEAEVIAYRAERHKWISIYNQLEK